MVELILVFEWHKESQTPQKTFNFFLFKEVIQPQVPLRLPCYDFALLKEPRFEPNRQRLGPHPNPFWVA